ncbi:MAG: hypothetical protein JJV89_02970 [Desulfosarcina sp.]|nr:hypothetical protein [Desulfobacterales bacterium]
MEQHERLVFLRLMTGTNQKVLADIAKIAQRSMASIEKGEYGLRGNRPELFSGFFGCRKEWFLSGEPPAYEQWGYWQFPPKNIGHKKKSAKVQQIRRQDKFIRLELGKFLAENRVTEYVFAKIKTKKNTLFFFELAANGFLLINTDIVMLDAVKEALQKISFKKSFVVDADVSKVIGSPCDENTDPDIITDLFKKAGFAVKKQFIKNTAKKNILSSRYLLVEKIARMIIKKELNITEIDACVKKLKKNHS